MATCSCGRYSWMLLDAAALFYNMPSDLREQWVEYMARPADSKYCGDCGDKLLPGGTVESRAELERDASRMRILDADGPTIDGYGGDYYTHYGSVRKLSEVADMLLAGKEIEDGN